MVNPALLDPAASQAEGAVVNPGASASARGDLAASVVGQRGRSPWGGVGTESTDDWADRTVLGNASGLTQC